MEEAYAPEYAGQYFFGREMMVAPISHAIPHAISSDRDSDNDTHSNTECGSRSAMMTQSFVGESKPPNGRIIFEDVDAEGSGGPKPGGALVELTGLARPHVILRGDGDDGASSATEGTTQSLAWHNLTGLDVEHI